MIEEETMSYIVWSQRCTKCKGQFYLEENEDGKYLTCIQCGHSEVFKGPDAGHAPEDAHSDANKKAGKELTKV